MSGEFGSYDYGYFDTQMQNAASDCLNGDELITHLWGEFFKAFLPVAHAIAWTEAGDSGREYLILECIKSMPTLKEKIGAISEYLVVFERIQKEAVREYIKSNETA